MNAHRCSGETPALTVKCTSALPGRGVPGHLKYLCGICWFNIFSSTPSNQNKEWLNPSCFANETSVEGRVRHQLANWTNFKPFSRKQLKRNRHFWQLLVLGFSDLVRHTHKMYCNLIVNFRTTVDLRAASVYQYNLQWRKIHVTRGFSVKPYDLDGIWTTRRCEGKLIKSQTKCPSVLRGEVGSTNNLPPLPLPHPSWYR